MTQTNNLVPLVIEIILAVIIAVLILIIAGLLIFPSHAYAGECLGSARAVRTVHGIAAWSTWRSIHGEKCWMLGRRHGKEVMRNEQRANTPETTPRPVKAAGALPLPPDWHGERIAIKPEEDTHFGYMVLLGDQWGEFYSACMGRKKSIATGLTSRWIGSQDAPYP